MEKTLENIEEIETQVSMDEFKETWGAVEVTEKPQDGKRKE